MKAAVCERYGPPEVLRVAEVEAPVPAHDEILVRIHASTVNSSDWYVRSGVRISPLSVQVPFRLLVGLRRPRRRIIGLILSGEVVEAGRTVTRFRPGDRVWAFTKLRFGAYAEYACLKETSSVAIAPTGVTHEEAAAIAYGGLMALHYLRRGRVRSGQRVLVYGASGAAGRRRSSCAARGRRGDRRLRPRQCRAGAVPGRRRRAGLHDLGGPAGRCDVGPRARRGREAAELAAEGRSRRALAPGGVRLGRRRDPGFSAAELVAWRGSWSGGDRAGHRPGLPAGADRRAHRYVETDHKRGNVVVTIG